MDSNSGSVPPNDQLPNSMPMAPNPVPRDSQEDKEKLALKQFWDKQLIDIESGEAFMRKQHLSPTGIKKLMKADEDIKVLISSEAPLVFAKACEMFIQELAIRAWIHAETDNRNTLEPCDITMAIKSDGIFDFLADVVDCGHNHDVDFPTKEGNAGNKGNRASETHIAGFKENPMMNMGEKVASNQQLPQAQIMDSPHLPSDKSKMKQPPCQFTDPHLMNQPPNFPSDQSQ